MRSGEVTALQDAYNMSQQSLRIVVLDQIGSKTTIMNFRTTARADTRQGGETIHLF